MKKFDVFVEHSSSKRCPQGQYWCYTDKKCKKIPHGYHIGHRGYLEQDNDEKNENDTNGNGHVNNGGNGNGNGGE